MVMITLIITTTLKHPDALGEARIVESPENDVFPGMNLSNGPFPFSH